MEWSSPSVMCEGAETGTRYLEDGSAVVRMKHVVLVTDDFPPLRGGIARLCQEVSTRLSQLGWRVTVICPDRGGIPQLEGCDGVRVLMVGGRRPLADLGMALALRRLVPVDVVMCGTWYPDGLISALAGVDAPLAIWAHGSELYDWAKPGVRGLLAGLRAHLRRRIMARAAVVLANSHFTQRLVRELVPTCRRVEVIPLGTDPSVFRPDSRAECLRKQLALCGTDVVLTVSRLVSYKGHETVMRAIAQMHPRRPLCYLIVGDGPYRDSLERLSEQMGIQSLVRFAGSVPDNELPLYYAMADVFALCTEERPKEGAVEGFGIAFLEAAAAGVPAIGTRAGGIPDAVVDGETGFLVRPGDPAAVSQAIERLLSEHQLALRMGRQARQRVLERFNWDSTAATVSRVLESLMPGARHEAEWG